MPMTPEAKRLLSTTIRALRKRLLDDLQAAAESAWRLSIKLRDAELVRDPASHKDRFLAWAKDEAGLSEAAAQQRFRLEAWIAEQSRAEKSKDLAATRERFRLEVEKQAAYTLLNRLIFLRLLEAAKLRAPEVVTGGWESRGYKQFREVAPALCSTSAGSARAGSSRAGSTGAGTAAVTDESEGYAFLLRLVFDDLAHELHGLYGSAGIADLIPIPSATLRAVVEELDHRGLETCWTDDMTLGWVYQYWNDPERERLDDKLKEGGKVEPHEIASKTQMFTERYMVEWLLQNSLGPMWLAMCKKHGWTARAEADGTLQRLEERRIDWRAKRDRGEVSLTELMPLHTDLERRWAYYVPQPIPADAVEKAPQSLKDLKLIDPACGSGHFLVVALELLVPLFQEEADYSGKAADPAWSLQAIVEHIFGETLHGVDLDPRAVQIATAALWLKARQLCPAVEPRTLHVVASSLRLAALPANDPALEELREAIQKETGIPGKLTDTLLQALRGADHLGSLLKIDMAVDEAILEHERTVGLFRTERLQGDLFKGYKPQQVRIDFQTARKSVEEELEAFLERHTSADDLGLRLRGEQLAAGVRFVRMMKEGSYDLVVGNPPYQGTSKMVDASYVAKRYPRGKADLYAAFLERGLELAREGGVSALLTMRNWMFLQQFSSLREWLLKTFDLRALGDFAVGAFDEVANDVLSVVNSVLRKVPPVNDSSVALQPTPLDDRSYDRERTKRKRAAVVAQVGLFEFEVRKLSMIAEWPLVYWWSVGQLQTYLRLPKLGTESPVGKGACTNDDPRFVRHVWETFHSRYVYTAAREGISKPFDSGMHWAVTIQGGKNREWMEPAQSLIYWHQNGFQIKVQHTYAYGTESKYLVRQECYFRPGIAFSKIGSQFRARAHRYLGIFGDAGPSVFPLNLPNTLCVMNSRLGRRLMSDLNPTINFQAIDIKRLSLFPVESADEIFASLDIAFTEHESHREPSVEFKQPGPSPWRYAQDWAQLAVDRPAGDQLLDYHAVYDLEPPTDHLSFALGAALGRFGAYGQGILDPAKDDLEHALPAGILFLDGTLDGSDVRDSIGHTAATLLRTTWGSYGRDIDPGSDLRTYLRTSFFPDVHRQMYENRPIHWPLSSEKRTFVAWVNIHRFTPDTLRILLAEHLYPTAARLEGELADLTTARYGEDKKAARAAERRYAVVQKAREELRTFIAAVEQCSEQGPPPVEGAQGKVGCPPREANARYAPDLDDGVMINSAALWPLLEAQWKDPAKWWKELATAQGRKDYDWSHLAMRYWPTRVDARCQADPSLGVAHGCFWRYHPARAWAWELRLQDEISADFRIVEAPYRGDEGDGPYRAAYLRDHPEEALAAVEKEALRRRRKHKRPIEALELLESGLWSALPDEAWAMEMRVIEKQQHDFHLRAPDEPVARAAWEAGHPLHVIERREIVLNLPAEVGVEGVDEGDEGDEGDGGEGGGDGDK